jgi:hypothetical protein
VDRIGEADRRVIEDADRHTQMTKRLRQLRSADPDPRKFDRDFEIAAMQLQMLHTLIQRVGQVASLLEEMKRP